MFEQHDISDAKRLKACQYCGQAILKSARRCQHCGTALTLLAKFERVSGATVFAATVATLVGTVFTVLSALDVKQDKAETEEIRIDIERIRSDANYAHLMSLHQNMENSANEWRRCKALGQPDCDLLSTKFVTDAVNSISAFNAVRSVLTKAHAAFILQITCVGIKLTHEDGKQRGLYASTIDHRDANAVDKIESYLRDCPVYELRRLSAHPILLEPSAPNR